MLKKKLYFNYSNLFICFFFSSYFIISWQIIEDFGVTLDDNIYYLNAVKTYEYIEKVFSSFLNKNLDVKSYWSNIKEFPIIYELVLVFICKFFNISDYHEIYLTSHRLNFIIFFLGIVFFYLLVLKRYKSKFISFIGIIFLILSPRIFAESFYNSRDIFFMCLFIFYSFSLFSFLSKKNFLNLLVFSFFSSLILNTKILGIIPIFIFLLLFIYNYLNTIENFKLQKKNISYFFLLFIIFIYLTWPYLWSNPIENLYFALLNILKEHEELILINYYFGEYLPSDMMPWHFRLVWFYITTPTVIFFLFVLGILVFLSKVKVLINLTMNKNYLLNKEKFLDLFFLITLFLSFFIVIEFNKSKFGGWRHLYFLYPIVVYFALYFIFNVIYKFKNKTSKIAIILLVIFQSIYNLFWLISNHPHQYIFFNVITKKYAQKNFDLDWWGISHKSSIDYILKNDNKMKIKVFAEGFTNLKDTYLYLTKKEKERIILSDYYDADYIIDTRMKRLRVNNDIKNNSNYFLFYELIVDNQNISSIYKKK